MPQGRGWGKSSSPSSELCDPSLLAATPEKTASHLEENFSYTSFNHLEFSPGLYFLLPLCRRGTCAAAVLESCELLAAAPSVRVLPWRLDANWEFLMQLLFPQTRFGAVPLQSIV